VSIEYEMLDIRVLSFLVVGIKTGLIRNDW